MTRLLSPFAYILGQGMARYALMAVRPPFARIEGGHRLPAGPAIYLGWHETNLLSMGLLRAFGPRSCCSIVPTGLAGATMRGYLSGIGSVEPVTLDERDSGSVRSTLRFLTDALDNGRDVVIAGDGPSGPAGRVRPGAAWLARRTGYPLVPIGYAAWPAMRFPRWDRLIVPLPRARVSAVVDSPETIEPRQSVDAPLLAGIEARLNAVTDRARDLVVPHPRAAPERDVQR